MTETDSPLKILVRYSITDIASWLLGQDVVAADELNAELTAPTPRLDMLFRVELDDERTCLLHLEFQGRRSRPEMSRRQLNHLSRLALQNVWPLTLESFVLYTERYAGIQDSGIYQVNRLDGSPALSWHYTPLHLWREPAESLLDKGKRGIIPLMGLVHIRQPDTTLPQMVEQVESEPDEERRQVLFGSLLALVSDQEHLAMLEQLIDSEEYVLDTPFLRRFRTQVEQAQKEAEQAQKEAEQAQKEAKQAQREAEQAQREAEQAQKKVLEARLEERRDSILETLALRFNPSSLHYREIQRRLIKINNLEQLQEIFSAALRAEDWDTFSTTLFDLHQEQS